MATGSNVTSGNLVGGELSTLLTAIATSLVQQSGHGSRFPSIPTNGYYYLVIIDTNVTSPANPLDRVEIAKATALTSDTFTLGDGSSSYRGLEGTSAKQFPITSSDPVSNVVVRLANTVEQVKEIVQDYLEYDEQTTVPDTPLATQFKTFAWAAGTGSALLGIDDAALVSALVGGAVALAGGSDATLSKTSARYNVMTPTALRTVTLDGSGLKMPGAFFIYNAAASQTLLIKIGTSYYLLGAHEWVLLMALQDVPTTGAHWVKMGGSQKLRVFTEKTQTFTADAAADTISLGTDDGLANAVAGEYDKAFYASSGGTLPAGLNASTAYYIGSAGATTCQLSLTPGGTAINITDAGTGTHTLTPQWIAPLGVQRVHQHVVGGGGGGGSGVRNNGGNTCASGGGGGAGGAARGRAVVVPGTAYAATIGAGGTGGAAPADLGAGNAGTDGANSSFNGFAGALGNGGGTPATATTVNGGVGGTGGAGTGGEENVAGGSGGRGAGDDGGSRFFTGGSGGHAPWVGGAGATPDGAGGAGSQGAGGGGGGSQEDLAAYAGGDGGDGVVALTY